MLRRLRLLPVLLVVIPCLLAGTPAEARNKFWVGGGIALGFGDVDWADLSGVFAYRVTNRVTTGLRLSWRNRSDSRFENDIETSDYGAAVFGRFYPKRPFFIHAEYEYLNYEIVRLPEATSSRTGYDSFLVGGGIAQPLGKNVSLFVAALYNVTYDSNEIPRPYDGPWIFRAGVGFSF